MRPAGDARGRRLATIGFAAASAPFAVALVLRAILGARYASLPEAGVWWFCAFGCVALLVASRTNDLVQAELRGWRAWLVLPVVSLGLVAGVANGPPLVLDLIVEPRMETDVVSDALRAGRRLPRWRLELESGGTADVTLFNDLGAVPIGVPVRITYGGASGKVLAVDDG